MDPIITIIVACDTNFAIGKDNQLPWKLPSELKHFRQYTLNKPVVCGKNTFISLPFLLQYRPMFVFSSQESTLACMQEKMDAFKEKYGSDNIPFLAMVSDVKEFLDSFKELYPNEKEICIIGGKQIYDLFYPYADKVILTIVNTVVEGADTFFDMPDKNYWKREHTHVSNYKTDLDEHSYSIYELRKKKSSQIISLRTGKPLSKFEIIKLRIDSKNQKVI